MELHPMLMLSSIWFHAPSDMGVMPAFPVLMADMSHSVVMTKPEDMEAEALYRSAEKRSESFVGKKLVSAVLVWGSGIVLDKPLGEARYGMLCMSLLAPGE